MKSKEFIQGLIEYLKNNLNIPDANFLKDRIKFKKRKYVYGEISFSNSRTFEGVILHLYAYNSEMGNFFSQNVPPYDKSSNPYDLVFVQPSISQAHFLKLPLLPHFLMEIPLNYLNLRMMQKTSIQMY